MASNKCGESSLSVTGSANILTDFISETVNYFQKNYNSLLLIFLILHITLQLSSTIKTIRSSKWSQEPKVINIDIWHNKNDLYRKKYISSILLRNNLQLRQLGCQS